MNKKSFKIIVEGKVQGVFFRKSTQIKADEFGIKGSVQNLPDNSVEVFISGDEAQTKRMLKWLETGPPMAEVSRIRVESAPFKAFNSFHIIRK